MTKEELQESVLEILNEDQSVMLADGFENAFMGISFQMGKPPHAVYDTNKCLDILMEEGMEREEAEEYFSYNVSQAYVGESTPAFLTTL
jgi:hypothetical protein